MMIEACSAVKTAKQGKSSDPRCLTTYESPTTRKRTGQRHLVLGLRRGAGVHLGSCGIGTAAPTN